MEILKITREELIALKPCSIEDRLKLFGRRKSLTASAALVAGASIRDILWVAERMGRKDLCVRFALACAQRVAYLNPDPGVQIALDATEAWLVDPSEANRKAARTAAAAVYAAASAAYAVYAAASAAASSSAAAAYAVYAAAAGRTKEITAQRELIKEIFG